MNELIETFKGLYQALNSNDNIDLNLSRGEIGVILVALQTQEAGANFNKELYKIHRDSIK